MSPAGNNANDYYSTLLDKPEMTALRGTMKRRLAAALMDEGQTVINKILQTDPAVLDNIWANRVSYDHIPAYLERASEILGEQHYVWRDLKAKEFYFRAMTIRKENYPDSSNEWRISEKRRLLERSLEWDSTSAVVNYEMGQSSNFGSNQGLFFYKKAAELSPNWALVYAALGHHTFGNLSLTYYKKAMALDSNFSQIYSGISIKYDLLGLVDSALYWRKIYVVKFLLKLKTDSTKVTAFECNSMGNVLWKLRRYEEAKFFLLRGEALSAGKYVGIYMNLQCVYTDLLEFENALQACKKSVEFYTSSNESLGRIYFFFLNDSISAAKAFEKEDDKPDLMNTQFYFATRNHMKVMYLCRKGIDLGIGLYNYYYYAESARQMGMSDTASHYFKVLDSIAESYQGYIQYVPSHIYKALALHRLGKLKEYNQWLDTGRPYLSGNPTLYFDFARIFAQTEQKAAAIESLLQAIEHGWQPNPLLWLFGTLCDPLLDPIRETEAFKALVRKHFPKYYDIATRIPGKK